jgi:hypothetical protein
MHRQTYSFMFATAGTFSVTDLLKKKVKSGTVSVKDRSGRSVGVDRDVGEHELQGLGHALRGRLDSGCQSRSPSASGPSSASTHCPATAFSTKVLAARSFAGKVVQLQRRSAGQWVTLKRVRLGSTSAATLKASLPTGKLDSALRVQRQPGRRRLPRRFSRTLVYHGG